MSIYYTPEGRRKWDESRFPQTSKTETSQVTYNSGSTAVLVACNIKTDVENISFKIVDNVDSTITLNHFDNSNITSWKVEGHKIILNENAPNPHTLIFVSNAEAILADVRLGKIIDGLNIQGCND